ncbi:MAG: SMP-30/gluconolactonase/LRE family protein, partial [Deltaproteobacteria bacterium]|nr:SMP-30/gluconolactonase/LRE family protein [Deltaproteobacteria bacterium]
TLPPPEPGPETGEPDAGAPDATAGEAAGDALAEPSAPPAKGSGGCAAAPGPAFPALLLLFLPFLALRVRPRMPSVLALFLLSCSPPSGTDPGPDTVAPVDQVAEDTRIPEDLLPDLPPDLPEDQVPDSPPDVPSELPPPEDTPPPDTAPDVPEPPLVDCDALPEGPFELEKVPGAIASEDLAFDGLGHLVGSDNQAIYKSTAGGQVSLLAPDVHFRAGMRYLPNGLLAVNDNNQGRVLVVYPDGSVTVLLGGLSYPNGMTVDTLGFIYVTEHDASRVLRIHSYTGEYTVLTDEIWNPNGITFNTTYDTLYIGSFGMAAIFALSISPDGVPGRLETWADFSDTPGLLDGMGVDACGNVYVCEYGATDVWRVSADGKTKKKIIIGGPYDTYLPNFQWGRGPGWDPESIYLPDGWKIGVWRARVGVPSAPLAFPPGG